MGLIVDFVFENGGKVIGIIIYFFLEREIVYEGIIKFIKVDIMFERKKKMVDLVDIFIVLLGGFGILEEIIEVVFWVVFVLYFCFCIFFNFDNYYNYIRDFYDLMVVKGYMKKEVRDKILFISLFKEIGNFIIKYEFLKVREYYGE